MSTQNNLSHTQDLVNLKKVRVNQNDYVEKQYNKGMGGSKKNGRTHQSMDLTNKQMQHLSKEMSGMIENNRQNAYLKQAGSYLLDSKDMQQQQGKCNGSSGVQLQQTEAEFDNFLIKNPSVNYFLQKQFQQKKGMDKEKVKERLMKYFFDNVEYFRHLAGKCKCFSCGCGHCKCNYVHKGVTDNYGTIYNNKYRKGGLKGVNELFLNQNNPVKKPEHSIGTEKLIDQYTPEKMHEGSNNKELYSSPKKKDYVQRVTIHEPIQKQPQLTQLSNYQMIHMETVKQPKEIQMIRSHQIVQNTPLVGGGSTTYNNQHHIILPPQPHHKVINVDNPLKTTSYQQPPINNNSQMTYAELQDNKRQQIHQIDNHTVQSFTAPSQFQSMNNKLYKNHVQTACQSKLK